VGEAWSFITHQRFFLGQNQQSKRGSSHREGLRSWKIRVFSVLTVSAVYQFVFLGVIAEVVLSWHRPCIVSPGAKTIFFLIHAHSRSCLISLALDKVTFIELLAWRVDICELTLLNWINNNIIVFLLYGLVIGTSSVKLLTIWNYLKFRANWITFCCCGWFNNLFRFLVVLLFVAQGTTTAAILSFFFFFLPQIYFFLVWRWRTHGLLPCGRRVKHFEILVFWEWEGFKLLSRGRGLLWLLSFSKYFEILRC